MRHNAKGGSIVSLASTRAEMSEPHTEAYAATKGGIIALTHALARSLGPDQITVNCISPGGLKQMITRHCGQSIMRGFVRKGWSA